MSNSSWPHGLQYTRLPCPSPSLRVCPGSCLLNWWRHPTISSSVALFFCLQSFPASGPLPMSRLFTSGGQSIGISASAPVLPEYSGFISLKINWFDLLAVQGTFKSLLQHHSLKASILWCSAFFMVQLSHLYMTTAKTIALTIQTFVGKAMSLLFNTLCRFVTTFMPRSNRLLISWLQSPSAVILGVVGEFRNYAATTVTAQLTHYFISVSVANI